MSSVIIKSVADKNDLKAFIKFHYKLYKDCPYDVPNLYSDELATLSKEENAAFDFCEAQYFLAYRDGEIVGRVAAIINRTANKTWDKQAVRFGWLDFIDDTEVSAALINAVEKWGRKHGMNKIQGPLGFTDMDPEGMLTMGFHEMGTMATSYNYDYYPRHFEAMEGFVKDNDYVEYNVPVPKVLPEKFYKVTQMIQTRYHLHVRKLTKHDIYKGGYGRKLFEIINATFSHLYGYSQMTDRQIHQYVDMYFPFADLEFVTVIEDASLDNKPIGVGITLPSLAAALQKCKNGSLFPFGWYYVLRALKFHKTKVVDLLLIGVLPEYRAKGAAAMIFADLIPRYIKYGIEWGETHVEMESNVHIQNQWAEFGPRLHKRRRCYIKDI